ncbi:MAG: hypothetical protein ABEJ65_05020 [bacterium]
MSPNRSSNTCWALLLCAFLVSLTWGCATRIPPDRAVRSNKLKNVWTDRSHDRKIVRVEFSKNGDYVASSSEDETLIVRNTRSGTPVHTIQSRGSGMNPINELLVQSYAKLMGTIIFTVGYFPQTLLNPMFLPKIWLSQPSREIEAF